MPTLFSVCAHAGNRSSHTGLDPLPPLSPLSQQDGKLKPRSSADVLRTINISPAHGRGDPLQLSRSFLRAALLASLLDAGHPSSPLANQLGSWHQTRVSSAGLGPAVFGEAVLEALAPGCGRAQPHLPFLSTVRAWRTRSVAGTLQTGFLS